MNINPFILIQFRNKLSDASNGTKSNLYNKAAMPSQITNVVLTYFSTKSTYDNEGVLKVTFDNVATFDSSVKEEKMLDTVAGTKEYTVTPTSNAAFTFVKIEIADTYTYSMYWESIVINLQ